jgi:hypothetical protein
MRPIRHIYFAEGALFIALALPAASYFGIGGLLTVSLVAHFAVNCILSFRASEKILNPIRPIIHCGFVSIAITLFIAILSFFSINLALHPLAIFCRFAVLVGLAALLGWFYIFTASLRLEFVARALAGLNVLRKRLINC